MKFLRPFSLIAIIFIFSIIYSTELKRKGKFREGQKSDHHIIQRATLEFVYNTCKDLLPEKNKVIVDITSRSSFEHNKRNLVTGPLAENRLIDDHNAIDYEILILLIDDPMRKTLMLGLDYYISKNLRSLNKGKCNIIKTIWSEIKKLDTLEYLEDTAFWKKKGDSFYIDVRKTKSKTDEKLKIQLIFRNTRNNEAINILSDYNDEITEYLIKLDNKLQEKRTNAGLSKLEEKSTK